MAKAGGAAVVGVRMVCVLGSMAVQPALAETLRECPSGQAVQPATQAVRPAGLERIIQQYLSRQWAGKVSRVAVQVIAPRKAVRLPAGRLAMRVTPMAKVVRPGPARVRVTFVIDGGVARTLIVAVSIQAYARVVLATRAIQRGQILSAADLRIGEWPIRAIEHGLAVSSEEAIGKRTRVAISAQRPIPKVALEAPKELSELRTWMLVAGIGLGI